MAVTSYIISDILMSSFEKKQNKKSRLACSAHPQKRAGFK